MTIECLEELGEEYGEFLGEQFERYAAAHGIVCNYTPFVFAAKEDGRLLGVLTGHAYYREVHVSDLILLEEHRRRGVGSELLQAAENHFRGQGYENINLSTYGFQAPGFYEKCGYTLEFTRQSPAEPKLTKYYYVKYL